MKNLWTNLLNQLADVSSALIENKLKIAAEVEAISRFLSRVKAKIVFVRRDSALRPLRVSKCSPCGAFNFDLIGSSAKLADKNGNENFPPRGGNDFDLMRGSGRGALQRAGTKLAYVMCESVFFLAIRALAVHSAYRFYVKLLTRLVCAVKLWNENE